MSPQKMYVTTVQERLYKWRNQLFLVSHWCLRQQYSEAREAILRKKRLFIICAINARLLEELLFIYM